jgi:ATP-binding cassette subfamily G (WHITE) protein 2 (PDR)
MDELQSRATDTIRYSGLPQNSSPQHLAFLKSYVRPPAREYIENTLESLSVSIEATLRRLNWTGAMSFLGGLGLFNNADATAERTGAAIGGTGRRPSTYEEASEHPLGLHRTSTQQSAKGRKSLGERPISPAREKTGDALDREKDGLHNDKILDSSSTDEEDEKRNAEVHQLARKFSRTSSFHSEGGGDINPFDAPEGSRLNPLSPGFSAKAWAKRAMEFHRADPDAHPSRTAGMAYKNLNVYGFGSPTDYQKSVSNIWLSVIGLAKRLVGQSGQTRINILRNFEGIIYAGELLVVLGPPGSGCTTLLKTISGEMSGLNVEDDAHINYQGELIPRLEETNTPS